MDKEWVVVEETKRKLRERRGGKIRELRCGGKRKECGGVRGGEMESWGEGGSGEGIGEGKKERGGKLKGRWEWENLLGEGTC